MYLTGMVYALMPAVFGLGQIYMIDVSMYSLGFSLSICLIFVFDKTRKIEQYLERTHGEERGGQQEAYDAIRKSYIKILKVDLEKDSFAAVYMDEREAVSDRGYDMRISKWLHDFAASGNIYPDDVEMFYKQMDIHAMKEHFTAGRETIAIHYRRRSEEGNHNALLEIIPAENFSEKTQIVFLYVKNIY